MQAESSVALFSPRLPNSLLFVYVFHLHKLFEFDLRFIAWLEPQIHFSRTSFTLKWCKWMMEFACLCGNIFKKIVSDVARTFCQWYIFLEILYRIAEDIYRLDIQLKQCWHTQFYQKHEFGEIVIPTNLYLWNWISCYFWILIRI